MIADISITEKSFGNKLLYDDLHLTIQAGEKVGLIGRNGVGKSTLLGIMDGTDTDFSGDLQYRRGLVIISTRQEHHGHEHKSVLEYILDDLPEYAALKRVIDTYPDTMGSNMKKITEYSEALARFDTLGYYTIEDQIIRELAGFQIDETKARGPLGGLSGGQKRLAEVVKVMHANAHLALIDEPTNHMDYIAKDQFIDWLKGAREAMLIITHDRDVLAHVDRIVEIKDKHAVSYPGTYDAYLLQNTSKTANQLNDYEVVQRQIANLKKQIQYARSKKAGWSGTADKKNPFVVMEERATRELKELEKIEKPTFWIDRESAEGLNYKVEASYQKHKARNIKIHGLKEAESKSSRMLIEVRDLALGYDGPLFSPINFEVREGERIEFRGRNGAGKTTLINALLAAAKGEQPATLQSGRIKFEPHIPIGVYEQEVSSNYFDLPLGEAIERLYYDRGIAIAGQKIRQLLSNYLFDPISDARIPLAQLSGGQKARFQLISMLANDPQLLILDEPTNHLDLPSIEELEAALTKYAGAVIYVSHDTHFRQTLPAQVVTIRG